MMPMSVSMSTMRIESTNSASTTVATAAIAAATVMVGAVLLLLLLLLLFLVLVLQRICSHGAYNSANQCSQDPTSDLVRKKAASG